MKNALAFVFACIAIAPWVFVILVVPMAWFFLGVGIMPENMRDPVSMFAWCPVFVAWTAFFLLLVGAVE